MAKAAKVKTNREMFKLNWLSRGNSQLNRRNPGEVTIDEFRAALGHGEIAFHNYQHQQVKTYIVLNLPPREYTDL